MYRVFVCVCVCVVAPCHLLTCLSLSLFRPFLNRISRSRCRCQSAKGAALCCISAHVRSANTHTHTHIDNWAAHVRAAQTHTHTYIQLSIYIYQHARAHANRDRKGTPCVCLYAKRIAECLESKVSFPPLQVETSSSSSSSSSTVVRYGRFCCRKAVIEGIQKHKHTHTHILGLDTHTREQTKR